MAKTNEHMSDVDGLITKIQGEVKKQLSTDGLQVSFFFTSFRVSHTHSFFFFFIFFDRVLLLLSTLSLLTQLIEEKINQLVKVMNTNIEMRLKALENKLDLQSESIEATIKATAIKHVKKHVDAQTEDLMDTMKELKSSTWMYAFGLLACIVLCGGGVLWRKVSSSGGGSMGLLGLRKKSWND